MSSTTIESFGYGFRKTDQQEEKVLSSRDCSESRTLDKISADFEGFKYILERQARTRWNFYLWRKETLGDFRRMIFDEARDFVASHNHSLDELHAFVVAKQDAFDADDLSALGVFLSAYYSDSKEKVIVYNLDVELGYLGVMLPGDKTLISYGILGSHFGSAASGLIINAGIARRMTCSNASGGVINTKTVNGKALYSDTSPDWLFLINTGYVGEISNQGLVVSTGMLDCWGGANTLIELDTLAKCKEMPELYKYVHHIESVIAAGEKNHDIARQYFSQWQNPSKQITRDMINIIHHYYPNKTNYQLQNLAWRLS